MVRKQVLRAFSVGMTDVETRKSSRCPRYEITGFRLMEVSIVDSPSNARCGIEIIGKSASGVPEFIGKAFGMAKGKKSRIIEEHYAELAALACGCQQCRSAVTKAAKVVRPETVRRPVKSSRRGIC